MKSPILVILGGTTQTISAPLKDAMERHRLDEDRIEFIQAHHWDYWSFPTEAPFDDRELKGKFSAEPEHVSNHAIFVRNSPAEYTFSGVICKDGSLIDLQDFGWRLIDEPSKSIDKARKTWSVKLKALLAENIEDIGVYVIVHC